jgi:hypothetical protein
MADEEQYGGDEEEQQEDYGQEEQEQDYGGGDEEQQQEEEQDYGGGAEEEQEQEQEQEAEPEQKEEPQQQQNYDYAEPSGGDFDASKSDIKAYCDNLYSDTPSFNWFTTTLVDEKLKSPDLSVDRTGKGGLPELVNYMKQQKSRIMFFQLRVNTYDGEGSSRAKFIYGRFVGSGVKFMMKAKLTPNLGKIAENFQVKHISKDLDEEMVKFTSTELSKEFLRIGGAHKPSRFDFGGGDVYEVKKK